ncbi:LacI family DNA-binding transcriptional regulator [Cellulomonas shaoxiangyii]|uniref:LacI family DNA-binding transcriptional regulator n=1 Tax=Cellulomonas shaoxiangyii TaxID=2566013 RepID=A0A4P7SJW1_9CELL|nr:LacI family DNA-binding transcriptional regulator [Cellulomonas shaoxiangyii]QCB92813.1 LacI family DNA-binding transcriptional regulator [Cellulomonas shaoxiangyii]TGY83186.1 LacI family DNA-binding transcriptional regulator [Cellulomonas shaoxiangyii]
MSDVAVVAGVSHQTVSRVLNDHPSVRPETRARVLDAIAALGYRRNLAARALVTRRTGSIGVITPGSALFGPTSTLVALERAARDAGRYVSVATLRSFGPDEVVPAVEHFLAQGVDGVVVVAPRTDTLAAVGSVRAPVPVVVISSAPEVDAGRSVSVDQAAGGEVATRHLLASGRRTVLHVAGPREWFDAQDRLRGWHAALTAAGVPVPPPVHAGWSAADGYEVGLRLVAEGLPDAVFAANDQLALGLLHAFRGAGVRVPDDVAVVGFDDEPGSAFAAPPLTTVRQGFDELGERAVAALVAALDGAPPGRELIAPELVVRGSAP